MQAVVNLLVSFVSININRTKNGYQYLSVREHSLVCTHGGIIC